MSGGGQKPGDEKKPAAAGANAAVLNEALTKVFAECRTTIEQWCEQANVERWGISRGRFAEELKRCALAKFRGAAAAPSAEELQGYFGTLHLEDLGLACACAEG